MDIRLTANLKNFTGEELVVDFIEVLSGKDIIPLTWDYSSYEIDGDKYFAYYEGVDFGEEDASGKKELLRNAKISAIGLYPEETPQENFEITKLEIFDTGKPLVLVRDDLYED